MKTMIVDSHQHVMLPTTMQVKKMDDAGVDKAILFTTTPHVERAESATLAAIGAVMNRCYGTMPNGNWPQCFKRKVETENLMAGFQTPVS